MHKPLKSVLTATSIAVLLGSVAGLSLPALAQDAPQPMATSSETPATADPVDQSVAESEDSGAVTRAHAEMATVLKKLKELGTKPFHTLEVKAARMQPTPADAVKAVVKDQTGEAAKPEAVAKVEDIKVSGAKGDLDARVYWPEGAPEGEALPVVVYFHGGGFVVADLDVYDASPRAIANQAKAIVVSVHYRQGPEDRFPAAHDDAIAAYKYVVENAQKWNGDGDRVALAGESAGGNLVVNVAIAAREQKLVEPAAVVAVYPVAGSDMTTPSYIENQNAVPLGKADMKWFVDNYLANEADAKDPRINLVDADLSGLPPTTIIAAEIDPLRSEGETLRDKLKAADVDVSYKLWKGVTHEFFGMGAVVPEAKEAEAFAGEALSRAFATN